MDRRQTRARGVLLLLALTVAIGACAPPAPTVRLPVQVPPPELPAAETTASAIERAYYAATQQTLLAAGLLRTEGSGVDTDFDSRRLAETFLKIAFYDEYSPAGGRFSQQETASVMGRWQDPVKVAVEFGMSVPAARQAVDRARIASYLQWLSVLTRHPIALTQGSPNFVVFIGSVDERLTLGPRMTEMLPGLPPELVDQAATMGRANFCLVYVTSAPGERVHSSAMAVIPSELPDLMGLMCLHEELAQGLGLSNDNRAARPSIFNDDNEFATLTLMDEMMLRMLYAPELTPGMTEAEARPFVEALAKRLMGEAS